MKLTSLSYFLASTALAVSTGAFSADRETILSHVNSPVMVNQGNAYVEASEGMQLFPGDQLMVMAGGSAQIEFLDGCLHELNSNDIYRISPQSACSSGVAEAGVNYQIQPAGTTGGSAPAPSGDSSSYSFNAAAIVATTVVIGVAIAIADTNDNDDRPDISP